MPSRTISAPQVSDKPSALPRPWALVLAKHALPGVAKTRLVPALGPRRAADAARWMAATLSQRLGTLPFASRCLALAPAGLPRPRWAAGYDRVIDQAEGDLGERIYRAMLALDPSQQTPFVLLGTDAPDLPRATLLAGLRAAQRRQCALCPAHDGGYCMLALDRPRPQLFENIAWGSPIVADQTRAAARAAGVPLLELPAWQDIDSPADVLRLIARLRTSRSAPLRELRERMKTLRTRLKSLTLPTNEAANGVES